MCISQCSGYVELLEVFGDELTVVNAARVSYGSQKEKLDDRDIKLIAYLKTHKHFSPFRHIFFRFIIKAPEVVMMQQKCPILSKLWFEN